jgi:hypothetical protein
MSKAYQGSKDSLLLVKFNVRIEPLGYDRQKSQRPDPDYRLKSPFKLQDLPPS